MKIIKSSKAIIAKVLIFLLFISFTPSLFAQNEVEELKMDIQLRPRSEFRNGLFTPILKGQKPAAFTGQRKVGS